MNKVKTDINSIVTNLRNMDSTLNKSFNDPLIGTFNAALKYIEHLEHEASLSPEILDSDCANKARPGEPVFILLGRDEQAPGAVRLWASMRAISEGPNEQTDEAQRVADEMEKYHDINTRT